VTAPSFRPAIFLRANLKEFISGRANGHNPKREGAHGCQKAKGSVDWGLSRILALGKPPAEKQM
jgi:hypothetical protein